MTTLRSLCTILRPGVALTLAVLAAALLTGCGDEGMSRTEVEEISRAAMAKATPPPTPEPGLTAAEVEEITRAAMAEATPLPTPEPGLTSAEVEEIVRTEMSSAVPPPTPEPGITSAEVDEVVQAAIAAIPTPEPGITSAEVEVIAWSAIAAMPAPDPGLTSAQVEEIARAVIAAAPTPDPGLTSAQVEEIARAVIAAAPTPDPGLTSAQVEEIARAVVAAAPKPDSGLSRRQVEDIVQTAIDAVPKPDSGLSRRQVEGIVQTAIAAAPTPEPGLTVADAERIARGAVAAIPSRSAPAEYTKFFVENAIIRYETQGLEAALAYYNREQSIDGQWYVFIIDENYKVIGHPDALRLGLDVRGWVGTDANGYNFGPEMLSATEEGKWVSYVYRNPESGGIGLGASGDFELKNVWVVRHNGLLFASGWYINADDFTKKLVSLAVDRFLAGGLEATIAYFAQPDSALAGLEAAIAYYNSAETVDGHWFAFIGDPDGNIVAHSNPVEIGKRIQELFGDAELGGTQGGEWVVSESLRAWVAEYNGYLFGSGWHHGLLEH